MDNKTLPIIDWELATKLAGNNRQAADELMSMFVEHLDQDLNKIRQHYQNNDTKALCHAIHRLHGAVSYCGLPRLKSQLHQLESKLKSDILNDLPDEMDQLESEVDAFLKHYKQ